VQAGSGFAWFLSLSSSRTETSNTIACPCLRNTGAAARCAAMMNCCRFTLSRDIGNDKRASRHRSRGAASLPAAPRVARIPEPLMLGICGVVQNPIHHRIASRLKIGPRFCRVPHSCAGFIAHGWVANCLTHVPRKRCRRNAILSPLRSLF